MIKILKNIFCRNLNHHFQKINLSLKNLFFFLVEKWDTHRQNSITRKNSWYPILKSSISLIYRPLIFIFLFFPSFVFDFFFNKSLFKEKNCYYLVTELKIVFQWTLNYAQLYFNWFILIPTKQGLNKFKNQILILFK